MTETIGCREGERTPARLGHRSGYYGRTLVTRVGKAGAAGAARQLLGLALGL